MDASIGTDKIAQVLMLTAASPQGLSHSRPVEDGRWRGSERELGNSRAIAHLQHVVVDEHVLAVEVEIVL